MTAQLFHTPAKQFASDAAERALMDIQAHQEQEVVRGDARPLPAHLQPNAALDAPATQEGIPGPTQTQRWERADPKAVNAQASITALVQSSGYLVRTGVGTCPACGKKGLDVSERRNTAHCYSAGCTFKSISPISWLMSVEGHTFPEAVAVITGQPLPTRPERRPIARPVPAAAPAPEFVQRPFAPLALAAQQALWAQETPAAEAALTYLLSRGFNGDELEQMGVGVADSTVQDALLPLSSTGKTALSWRNRVIIPTWSGRACVNLKARTLEPKPAEDTEGRYKKYLNVAGGSAELIGLDGNNAPAELILTEGELDYHTLRILFPDRACVAVRGLANLSPAQAQLLACSRVTVLLDADTHGHRMLLGNLRDVDDAAATAALKAEGLKFGAALEGRRLVRKLLAAGADVHLAATDTEGDLNDLLAHLSRDDARAIISAALLDATPLRRRRTLR